jgi:2-keto-myo-inositol isomerase
MPLEIGLNLATIMTTPLETALEAAGRAGFRLVELRAPAVAAHLESHSTGELAARIAAAGLRTLSLNSVEGFDLPGAKEAFRQQAEWAAAVGCPHVIVVPARSAMAAGHADRLRRAAEAVARLDPLAKEAGVRMAVEFLGFADSTIRTLAEAAEVAAASPRADLVIDTFHLGAAPVRGEPVDRLAIVHLADLRPGAHPEAAADADRCLPGEGTLGMARTLADLAASGFDGPVSVELFSPELWRDDPFVVAARAHAAAAAILP